MSGQIQFANPCSLRIQICPTAFLRPSIPRQNIIWLCIYNICIYIYIQLKMLHHVPLTTYMIYIYIYIIYISPWCLWWSGGSFSPTCFTFIHTPLLSRGQPAITFPGETKSAGWGQNFSKVAYVYVYIYMSYHIILYNIYIIYYILYIIYYILYYLLYYIIPYYNICIYFMKYNIHIYIIQHI